MLKYWYVLTHQLFIKVLLLSKSGKLIVEYHYTFLVIADAGRTRLAIHMPAGCSPLGQHCIYCKPEEPRACRNALYSVLCLDNALVGGRIAFMNQRIGGYNSVLQRKMYTS